MMAAGCSELVLRLRWEYTKAQKMDLGAVACLAMAVVCSSVIGSELVVAIA